MKTFNEYLDIVNEAVAGIKDRYPKQPVDLYAPIYYTMSLSGKRLRPVLMLMACEAVGGKVGDALLPAVGLELFHNFTLLHDDLMDRADVRRGKPTVYRKWNDNVAVLSGDAMLTMATQYIAKANDKAMRPVMELYNKTAMEIYEGQQWDMDFEHRDDVKEEEYLEMIRLKTSVLLGCACKMGALLGGASKAVADDFYHMGVNVGLAFQLQDDVLDVWGNPATFGKATGGDIMNNKKTFLLINAMNMAAGDDAKELHRWLDATDAKPEEKIPAVTAIYEKLGLRELSEQRIAMFSDHALATLGAMRIDASAKQAFNDLIVKLIKRDR